MIRDALLFGGILSPAIYIFMTVLGGALRPGYSHITDTVSELFSPGSPNKRLLDRLNVASALFAVGFGMGLLWFVLDSDATGLFGLLGASLFLANGIINIATAGIFPQDPMGAPRTFAGKMHIALVAAMALSSILGMVLFGAWMYDRLADSGYGIYSFITASVMLASGLLSILGAKTLPLGLIERISVAIYLQWSTIVAIRLIT